MGPQRTPPERPWLFFTTCFQIVQFRGLVAFHDLLGLPTYQFVIFSMGVTQVTCLKGQAAYGRRRDILETVEFS
ncbi:unnamed protein product [Callosobruchus maculatus]|uniref:Uncharacterized protein n=1 Tax=Callosobruchus maculatus TaxID=64391 RepID=A0A653CLT4_CALMS|nr:unnamed protein product [Callosobruchus maculatus]